MASLHSLIFSFNDSSVTVSVSSSSSSAWSSEPDSTSSSSDSESLPLSLSSSVSSSSFSSMESSSSSEMPRRRFGEPLLPPRLFFLFLPLVSLVTAGVNVSPFSSASRCASWFFCCFRMSSSSSFIAVAEFKN
jgi:hypothetical protein